MMLLAFVATAAAELPWECPPITEPADADVYRGAGGGAQDVLDQVQGLATAWEAYDCAWVETSGGDGEVLTTLERVCDDGYARVESWSSYHRLGDTDESEYTLSVTVPAGETWTNLRIDRTGGSSWDSYDSSGATSSYGTTRATWTGAIDGLPDDAWIEIASGSSRSDWYEAASRFVDTPACSWRWEDEVLSSTPTFEESVWAGGHTVSVWRGYDEFCGEDGAYATLDGVVVGAVDATTWARNLADADGDGWPAGTADCDDADPARSSCAGETPNDGVDQDCDGADWIDADVDRDGHDGASFGGDDCDDADPDAYPGANENGGDGVDQDCDGADDTDADDDGYTADGDSRRADCDDADADVNPGEPDVPYDGVDQDCTGADETDMDDDGVDAREAGGQDCNDRDRFVSPDAYEHTCDGMDQDCDGSDACPSSGAPAEGGCGGGAAWLALLPAGVLGRWRRRMAVRVG